MDPTPQVVTEVSLVVLLFGTLCGDYALLADIGKKAVVGLFPDAPGWIHDDPGRLPMVVLGLVIVFPLSCLRRMRQVSATLPWSAGAAAVVDYFCDAVRSLLPCADACAGCHTAGWRARRRQVR